MKPKIATWSIPMKNRSAKLLFFILSIAGVLLQDFSAPVSGLSAEFRIGAVTTNVNLRKTPSLQGDIVAGLQQGSPVKIYGEKDGWYRVSSEKNYIPFNGWVYKRYVEIVLEEITATTPDAEIPKSVAGALPEKPPPAPVEKSTPPELAPPPLVAKPQAVLPSPEPDNQTVGKPLELEITVDKTESPALQPIKPPPSVEKAPESDTGTKPAGTLRLILSISPLVLAVIALLIAARAYRAARTSGRKVEKPKVPAEITPGKEKPAVDPGKPPVSEKRRSPRTNRLIEVDFAVGGNFHRGFINNLSETGVYIDTPVKFSIGQEIMISCPSIDTGGYVKRSGLIVRKTDVGIAVHFQKSATE